MVMDKKYQQLNAENIQRLLKTKTIGKEVVYFPEIDSTNQYGLKLLRGHIVSHGMVIVCNHQTSGRGRHGKKWVAPRGKALLFSTVFTEMQNIKQPQMLAFIGAISVAETILQVFPMLKPTIRWPNDILINGKKIAGILVETTKKSHKDLSTGAVMGIGININQSRNDFPDEMNQAAASLFMFTGRRILRLEILIPMLEHLERFYTMLEQGYEKRFWSRLKKLCSTLGKGVQIHTPDNKIIAGTAVDIDNDGGLLVRLDNGTNTKFYSGDVIEVEWIA